MLGAGWSWLGMFTFKLWLVQRSGTPQTHAKIEKNVVEAKKEKKKNGRQVEEICASFLAMEVTS